MDFAVTQALVFIACYVITIVHEHCCKHLHEKHRASLDATKDFAIHIVIYSGLIPIFHH